jgi:mono/diheme cytochrome c family protein
MMKGFILGIVVTLFGLFAIGLVIAQFGIMPTNADATPPAFESRLAMGAVDAAMERNAPRVNNPVPATDENLIAGMKIYTMNCAVCHGTLDNKPSPLSHSFYPPPPQLVLHPMDDPEWQIYYFVRTGIRYTGMPAWSKALSEQDMWKVTAFLTRVDKLPPAVQDYWKKAYGVGPETHEGEHHHHDAHHE